MNRSDALKGERVMNFFASLLVFFAGLLLIYIFSAIIRLVTRGRGGLLAGILPMLLVVVIGAGLSFYLDNNGDIV